MMSTLLKQNSIKFTTNDRMNIAGEPVCFENGYAHDYKLFGTSYGLRCNS